MKRPIGWTLAMVVVLVAGCGRRRSVCTDYLDQLSTCIAKMGPAARAAEEQNLRREREQLRKLEQDPATRARAVASCQASLAAIKPTCR